MIFISLGTQDKEFKRILDVVDKSITDGVIKDKVIAQTGFTKYKSNNMEIVDYMDSNRFNDLIKSCDLFITHAGVGNIFSGLDYNKKVLVMPRLSSYKEHTNDHQLDITNSFLECGYIKVFNNYEEFINIYKDIDKFIPNKYKSNNKNFIKLIEDFIDGKKV